MTAIATPPSAVHIGAEELPFVDLGGGNKLKVLQVKEREGLWVIRNRFMPGYLVQTHKHTGPVYAFTTTGAWRYKESDFVNRAGSFLYEPAGSVPLGSFALDEPSEAELIRRERTKIEG